MKGKMERFNESSVIKIKNAKNITIKNTIVSDINYAKTGGFLDLTDSAEAVINNCTFSDISAYRASAISIS